LERPPQGGLSALGAVLMFPFPPSDDPTLIERIASRRWWQSLGSTC
jgi:hypothetical protein